MKNIKLDFDISTEEDLTTFQRSQKREVSKFVTNPNFNYVILKVVFEGKTVETNIVAIDVEDEQTLNIVLQEQVEKVKETFSGAKVSYTIHNIN